MVCFASFNSFCVLLYIMPRDFNYKFIKRFLIWLIELTKLKIFKINLIIVLILTYLKVALEYGRIGLKYNSRI